MNILVLICGLPNSGKTTASLGFEKVYHLDDYNDGTKDGYDDLFNIVREASGTVVVEGTFCVKEKRQTLLSLKKWDKAICMFADTPVNECLSREQRGRPKAMIYIHDMILEKPSIEEGWNIVKNISEL